MRQYLDLLRYVLTHGQRREDRTGTGTLGVFGAQARFDLREGFPLLTTKKLHVRSIIHELLWFLRGETNISYLKENGVSIWDEWADEHGHLGPVYGKQWRRWETQSVPPVASGQATLAEVSPEFRAIEDRAEVVQQADLLTGRAAGDESSIDQLAAVMRELKTNPFSRRLIVSAWNVADLPRMALPPCHVLFQFYVDADHRLSCQLYQRSADLFLGVPFNIASYALLTLMVAQVGGFEPGEFIHTFGDLHLYTNHLAQAHRQLAREPRPLPTLRLNPTVTDLFRFRYEDFTLEDYDPHPHIKAPVAV